MLTLLQMVSENPLAGIVLATFATYLTVSAAVVAVSGWVNSAIGAKGVGARIISLVVAAALVAVGYFFHLGYLGETSLVQAATDALSIWLTANGIFTADFVKRLLVVIGAKQPSVIAYVADNPK